MSLSCSTPFTFYFFVLYYFNWFTFICFVTCVSVFLFFLYENTFISYTVVVLLLWPKRIYIYFSTVLCRNFDMNFQDLHSCKQILFSLRTVIVVLSLLVLLPVTNSVTLVYTFPFSQQLLRSVFTSIPLATSVIFFESSYKQNVQVQCPMALTNFPTTFNTTITFRHK